MSILQAIPDAARSGLSKTTAAHGVMKKKYVDYKTAPASKLQTLEKQQ